MTEAPVNLGIFLRKRLTVKGSTLRARPLDYKAKLTQEVCKAQAWLMLDRLCVNIHEYTQEHMHSRFT